MTFARFGRGRIGQYPTGDPIAEGLDHGSQLLASGGEPVAGALALRHPLDDSVTLQAPEPLG